MNRPAENLTTQKNKLKNPKFQGLTFGWILKDIFKNLEKIRLFERAAAITFNLILAVPPALIFLASLVPFFPVDNIANGILQAISTYIPSDNIGAKISSVVIDFLTTKRRDLLSLGLLFSVIYSSNGLMGIMRAFDRNSDAWKFRSAFKRRLKAIWLTITLMILTLIIVALLIAQTNALNYFINEFQTSKLLIKLISWGTLVGIVFIMICIIYRFCPSLYTKVRFFNLGAVVATTLILLLSAIFIYASGNVIKYDQVYGPLGTLLMFLVWVNFIAILTLLGFEINMTMMIKGKLGEELQAKINPQG